MKEQYMNVILAIEAVLLVLLFGYIMTRPAAPCIESLDVTRGRNFNQPILTEHNCQPGQVPTNWRSFEAK